MLDAKASSWPRLDAQGNETEDYEDPVIYIDEDGDQLAEMDLSDATRLANSLLLAILQARSWAEGYEPTSGVTENFMYALRSTTTHTGGVHAQD